MNGIGQEFNIQRAMIVLIDDDGKAHAWDVNAVRTAKWEWTGMTVNRSTAKVTLEGEFHRRSRNLDQFMKEMEK